MSTVLTVSCILNRTQIEKANQYLSTPERVGGWINIPKCPIEHDLVTFYLDESEKHPKCIPSSIREVVANAY